MRLRNIVAPVALGFSLACAPEKPIEKTAEMVEVDVGMPRAEFVKRIMKSTDSAKRVMLATDAISGKEEFKAPYQINYVINDVEFMLTREDHFTDKLGWGSLCVRPANDEGFYLKIDFRSPSDYFQTGRWDISSTRRLAQKFCEELETKARYLYRPLNSNAY